METSDDESSSIIDFHPEIAVNQYRLTITDSTLPLYIIHTDLPFRYNLEVRNGWFYL